MNWKIQAAMNAMIKIESIGSCADSNRVIPVGLPGAWRWYDPEQAGYTKKNDRNGNPVNAFIDRVGVTLSVFGEITL
jgi:hypothetical protein